MVSLFDTGSTKEVISEQLVKSSNKLQTTSVSTLQASGFSDMSFTKDCQGVKLMIEQVEFRRINPYM